MTGNMSGEGRRFQRLVVACSLHRLLKESALS